MIIIFPSALSEKQQRDYNNIISKKVIYWRIHIIDMKCPIKIKEHSIITTKTGKSCHWMSFGSHHFTPKELYTKILSLIYLGGIRFLSLVLNVDCIEIFYYSDYQNFTRTSISNLAMKGL